MYVVYGYFVFQLVLLTWQGWYNTKIVLSAMANKRWHVLLSADDIWMGFWIHGDMLMHTDVIGWHSGLYENIRSINSLRLRQNGCYFADNIFKCIFFNENVWIVIKISLNFILKCPINNILAMVEIMACPRPGYKPLSEPICVTLPQCVKTWPFLYKIS